MRAQETVGERLVFAQQPEQQVLGLNIGGPELAGLISCKEDYAPCLLGIAFKHGALPRAGLQVQSSRPVKMLASALSARALCYTAAGGPNGNCRAPNSSFGWLWAHPFLARTSFRPGPGLLTAVTGFPACRLTSIPTTAARTLGKPFKTATL